MERTESRFSTLQAVLVVTSCIGAVKLVPPAGRPVPVTVPESCSTPFTTDVVKLPSWPVNAVPSGRVPVTGRSVVAGCAAAALGVCGAADALVAVPAIPKVAVMARATAPVVIRLEKVTLSPFFVLARSIRDVLFVCPPNPPPPCLKDPSAPLRVVGRRRDARSEVGPRRLGEEITEPAEGC